MNARTVLISLILTVCAICPLSLTAAQPVAPCPAPESSEPAALLDAAEACLQYQGPFLERNAAQALIYAQDAVTDGMNPADQARAYDLQGQAHFWLDELGQAIARQTQALVLEPTADRYLWRAVTMNRVNDTAGAIADGQQAIALEPDRVDLYLWLGQYALDQGETDLAVDVMTRAAALAPDNADVLKLQGDAFYAAAKTAFDRYMTVAPDPSPAVIAKLQVIERRLGGG